jgi:hypothetical protein
MTTFQRASATVIVGLLGLVSIESYGQQAIDLYILAGQSNAVGQGVLLIRKRGVEDRHDLWIE